MIPVRMQIKGFLSYHDQVDLHFDTFDLACISGSNGAGKSSLLDAITWVLFGEARRRDDSIINHQSNGAEVILDFDYENVRYRVQRGKVKDKSTTLDFFIQSDDGGWKTLTEATLRATEDRIKQTLRLDYETFTNASFFLQGKADQFSQQRPGDRKRILASILGLEIWERYKEEAARRRRGVEIELANIEGVLAEIETELKEEEERKTRLAALEKEYIVNKELADVRKKLLDQQRLIADRFATDKKQIDKQTVEIKRLKSELDQRIDDLRVRQEERKNFRTQIDDEKNIRIEYERWLHLQKQLEKMETIAVNFRNYESKRQAPLMKIEGERASAQTEMHGLRTRQSEIVALQNSLVSLSAQVEEYSQIVKTNTDRLAKRPQLEAEFRELVSEKARLKAENSTLKIEMDELKDRITALQQETGALCPTCEKPLSASERQKLLDELNTRGKTKGDAHRENIKMMEQCEIASKEKESELQALQTVESELKQQHRLLDTKTEELRKDQAEIDSWMANGHKRLEILQSMLETEAYAQDARGELVSTCWSKRKQH
jgi:exonuclease SbcC